MNFLKEHSTGIIGVSAVAGLAFLGYQKLFPKKSIPEKIDLEAFMRGDKKAKEDFFNSLKEFRFVIFKCDEETKKALKEYKKAGLEFFSLPNEEKLAFCGKAQYDEKIDDLKKRKINKGYLLLAGMKEFLKLQEAETVPSNPADLKAKFDKAFETYNNIAKTCLDTIATTLVNGAPFMDPKFYTEVKKRLDKSSLSLVKYFSVSIGSPDDNLNNSNDYEISTESDREKDKMTHDGMTYPSKTHTDTGIMTFIICSDVPGLQVWDHKHGGWLEVEKIVDPMGDMFCIMGRKMPLFAAKGNSVLQATTHRVALPLNTERSSLLFFQDVPQ